MTSMHELKDVPDDELLRRLTELVRRSRRVEAVLLAHIAEVDERRLYVREAPSMFAYCTRALHLSEHEAYARIAVARAARRHPVLLAMLGDGRLHLSAIAKLAPHLTDANRDELLTRAVHRTKSEIEELLAEIAPRADVAALVRKLPGRQASGRQARQPLGAPAATGELGLNRVGVPGEALQRGTAPASSAADHRIEVFTPALLAPPAGTVGIAPAGLDSRPTARPALSPVTPPAPAVTPLAPSRYKIQFTAGSELRDKLERLQALLGQDLATAIEAAVTEKLERLAARRFGATKAPRRTLDETDTAPRSRHLPAAVRRQVHERDGEQCTFRLRNGTRCPERRGLEFHHRHPFGRGGDHDPENVCLMCRQHNAHLAERDYGTAHMAKHRRRRDRMPEGLPLVIFGERAAHAEARSRPRGSALTLMDAHMYARSYAFHLDHRG